MKQGRAGQARPGLNLSCLHRVTTSFPFANTAILPYNPTMQQGFPVTIQNAGEFFMKTGPVHQALADISKRLEKEGIDYALIGGMALGYHGFVRVTQDIHLLLTKDGLRKFKNNLVGRVYVPLFPGANKHFKDTAHGVTVKIITSGEYPGDGRPKEVVFPDPGAVSEYIEGLKVVHLETLIELKLGPASPRRIASGIWQMCSSSSKRLICRNVWQPT